MARQAKLKNHSLINQVTSSYHDPSASWNRPEILLVEDGTGVFDEIGYILQEQGFQVLLAPDALTALQEVGNYQVDVVMVSADRQDTSGLQVLEKAKCFHPDVVTVVLTRGFGGDLPVEAYESEVDCYLGWPILPGDLGRRLMNLLADGILEDTPWQQSPTTGKVDRRVWFLLGRFIYEVWTALNQAGDSLNLIKDNEIDCLSGKSTPQVENLSQTITNLTDSVERFIRETPWPNLNPTEAWEDNPEIFRA